MANKNPLQFKFPFALWTAAMLQTLIAVRFEVRLSHSSVCRLLDQLGLSAQRLLWRAYQQNPEAVKRGLEKDYPAIRRRAKREKAQIFFADEAGERSDYHSGTTRGRRGPQGSRDTPASGAKSWSRTCSSSRARNRSTRRDDFGDPGWDVWAKLRARGTTSGSPCW